MRTRKRVPMMRRVVTESAKALAMSAAIFTLSSAILVAVTWALHYGWFYVDEYFGFLSSLMPEPWKSLGGGR